MTLSTYIQSSSLVGVILKTTVLIPKIQVLSCLRSPDNAGSDGRFHDAFRLEVLLEIFWALEADVERLYCLQEKIFEMSQV